MKRTTLAGLGLCAGLAGLSQVPIVLANDDVMKRSANPAEKVLQTVDYANTRFSKLTRSTPAT